MPSSKQLLSLPNLQRNLLFSAFLETFSLTRILESRAAIRNSPTIHNTISLFHTYVAFRNFYTEKPPSYNKYDRQMGQLILDICRQMLNLLSNLGFCRILAAIPDAIAISTIEQVLRSLSEPDLAVYLNSSNPRDLPAMSPARDSLGPNLTNGHEPPTLSSDHSSTPTLDVQNPSLSGLSALAARISRALVEGRPSLH